MLPRFLLTLKQMIIRCTSSRTFLFPNYHHISEFLSFPILKAKGNILIALMPGAKLHTCRELKSLKCTSVLFLVE